MLTDKLNGIRIFLDKCKEMPNKLSITISIFCFVFLVFSLSAQTYFPPLNEWETKTPEELGASSVM